MTRRWTAGWTGNVGGILFRVVPGKKATDDLRLEWRTANGWVAIPMAPGALMADFWYENEEVLYPPSAGYLGGKKYRIYLDKAMQSGWLAAEAILQVEKAKANGAIAGPVVVHDGLVWDSEAAYQQALAEIPF